MQTSIMSIFNQNVRTQLDSKGWTIKQLADEVGMHREALSKILNGHVDTSMGNAQKIADALEVPLAELVTASTGIEKKRKKHEPQAA